MLSKIKNGLIWFKDIIMALFLLFVLLPIVIILDGDDGGAEW